MATPNQNLPAGWQGPWDRAPKLDDKKWKVGKVGKGPRRGKYVAKPITAPRAPRAPSAPRAGASSGKPPLWGAKPKNLTQERIEALWGPGATLVPTGGKWTIRLGGGGRAGAPNFAAAKPPDPYAGNPDAALLRQYEGEPWAQNLIRQLRSDQQHHEGYVANQVMPWQSGALGALAGINQQAQDNFTGQANAVAQGLAQAGGAQPGTVQGVSGGAVTSPNAYQQAASAQGMANQASTMGQMAAWQGLMGTLQPTTYSQGQIAALSDYARGLPVLYAEKRAERIDAIDKYLEERAQAKAEMALELAKFEEAQRANRVGEAISATNAQTNAAIAFANLGIDAANSVADNAPEPTFAPGDIPFGFVQLPNGDIVRDPTVPQATDNVPGDDDSDRAPSPSRGEYPPNKLRKEGYRPLPPKAGPAYKRRAVEATDGTLWYKPGRSSSGSSGGSPPKPRNAGTLQSELRRLYDRGGDGGWEWRYDDNPRGAAQAVTQWVVSNKNSFGGAGKPVKESLLAQLLRDEIGGANVPRFVVENLQRNHFRLVNGRWVWK